MTNVLVATASRHGATDEIARTIGEVLADAGLEVSVAPMGEVDDLAPYDAYVLGSAIYLGRWLREARSFVEDYHELLSTRPTWLFSSGPVHDGLAPADRFDPHELMERVGARDHCLISGRLDSNLLGLRERAVVKLVRAEDGDHREWDTVAAWATAIARTLDDTLSRSEAPLGTPRR
jgi:menaquinone-dependent protoporphyrinogen oxidase